MQKKSLKKLLLPALIAAMFSTNLLAADRETYIGVKLGSLDFDKTIIANTSGYENIGPYSSFDDVSLVGFEMQWFRHTNSAFVWGYGFDVLLNDGSFQEGGMLDFDFKLGASFNDFKIYGILGVGVQALSDYTAAGGTYIGIGATFNVAEHFGLHATYTNRNMTTVVNDYNSDFYSYNSDPSDDQDYESSGVLFGITYKY